MTEEESPAGAEEGVSSHVFASDAPLQAEDRTTPQLEIETLTEEDASTVSELAIRSKGHWGYSAEQMAVFRDELTMTPQDIASRTAFGAWNKGRLVGYYTLLEQGDGIAELEHLFVDPASLRTGIGSALLNHALVHCETNDVQELPVVSDPNAAGFYEYHGARLVEQIPSSIPGRLIPKYQFSVALLRYLRASNVINWYHESIRALAAQLQQQSENETSLVRHTFEWVRDHVQHSLDHQRTEVTWNASDVLELRTGYCYAKSHLLAALLRANGIPTGFCYQRLSLHDNGAPFSLHGLNAVYLQDHGWYRIDARGNKPGVIADFSPPVERLAFAAVNDGEFDFPQIVSAPLPIVVDALQNASSVQSLAKCLPDMTRKDMEQHCRDAGVSS